MDALSDVLRVVRLTGGVFLDARFTAPWSVSGRVEPQKLEPFLAAPEEVICFHYVVSGRLVAQLDGVPPTEMKTGDVILFPRNDAHVLASALDLKPQPAGDVVLQPPGTGIFNVTHGGGGEETHVVCGYLGSDGGANPLLQSLPAMLTLNVADTPAGAWIAESFAFVAQQLARQEAGAGTIIAKLSELMFVEAVRRYIDGLPPQQAGWLAGLRDPHIGRALALMHTKPAHDWTAEDLANAVNMSRSAFADRFHAADRHAADEVSHQLAHAGRRFETARTAPDHRPDRVRRRLRVGGRLHPRLPARDGPAARHLAQADRSAAPLEWRAHDGDLHGDEQHR